jgi:hypothetical protein
MSQVIIYHGAMVTCAYVKVCFCARCLVRISEQTIFISQLKFCCIQSWTAKVHLFWDHQYFNFLKDQKCPEVSEITEIESLGCNGKIGTSRSSLKSIFTFSTLQKLAVPLKYSLKSSKMRKWFLLSNQR